MDKFESMQYILCFQVRESNILYTQVASPVCASIEDYADAIIDIQTAVSSTGTVKDSFKMAFSKPSFIEKVYTILETDFSCSVDFWV